MENLDYKFLVTKDLEHIWTICDSENGKTVLVGFGKDEAQLLQIDLETKSIAEYYWLPGQYPLSNLIIDNSNAIIGTNNGYITLIDLDRKERIKSKLIAGEKLSIKDIQFSSVHNVLFTITTEQLLAVDYNTFEVLHTQNLDFNPWDIVLIPHTNLVTIEGSHVKLELYQYTHKGFSRIDHLSYGSENMDMTSLAFNEKYSWLISSSETGYLYFWNFSKKRLNKHLEIPFEKDRIYHTQSFDQYIAFSSSKNGACIIDISQNKLINIPKSQKEGKINLKKINNNFYLLYLKEEGNISIADLSNNNVEAYSLENNLSKKIDQIKLTANGSIIGVTKEGVIITSLIKNNKEDNNEKYNFNSKFKNIIIKDFIFNEKNNSILLQCKDSSLKIVDLENSTLSTIDIKINSIILYIHDFHENFILYSDLESIYRLNTIDNSIDQILNKKDFTTPIDNIKTIDKKKFAITNSPDYMATPIIWKNLKVYDFNENLISTKKLDSIYSSMFVTNNNFITTSMHEPSTILDFSTNQIKQFDIGFTFDENDGTVLSKNLKFCMRIAIGDQFKYYMTFYDLSKKDENNYAKQIWQVEDPLLKSFSPLEHCEIDDNFYIIDKLSGHMFSINSKNGDIIDKYELHDGIAEIKMSNSGNYIAWKLKTGDFSYISYPFESCKALGSNQTWRTQKKNDIEDDRIFLKRSTVAELWQSAFQKIDSFTFRSSESEKHQLDPFNYSLKIPDKLYLINYDVNQAILTFLGKGSKINLNNNENIATIYHELFHVFQSITTKYVLD